METTQRCFGIIALALACACAPLATHGDELRIQSFGSTGTMPFNRIPTGQAYRVECATSLTGAWTRLTNAVTIDGIPTTMNCIPGKGGIVTGAVPVQASAMFFRAVADTNEMAFIPAGEFVMGAATNAGASDLQHTVYVSPFYISRYEVTKALWDSVCTWAATHAYTDLLSTSLANSKGPSHPMQWVGWYTAAKWCNARSEMEGLTPCYTNADGSVFRLGYVGYGTITIPIGCKWNANGYRLPTEAEWEKAARGGFNGRRFPWIDTDTIQQTRANYFASTNRTGIYAFDMNPTAGYHLAYTNGVKPYTSPVGSFAPNGYGLYDMAGNAHEWCWDFWSDSYYLTSPNIDPRGPSSDPNYQHVLRDGCWEYPAVCCKAGYRNLDRSSDSTMHQYQCFRVARSFTNTGTNQAPVIAGGASTNVTMSEDGAPTPFSLTLYATDANRDTINWWTPTAASHGTAMVSGSGENMPIVYQPASNYYGSDSFVVQAYDPWGATTSITVNVTVVSVNDPPVANPQVVSVATNTPRAITLTGSDLEGSGLTYTVVDQPTHGSLSNTPPNVTYTPFLNYKGPDSFTFKVHDDTEDSVAPATVTLWVNSMAAQGGTMTNYTANGTNYTAHIFTTVGSASLVVAAGGVAQVLVVAGGGGGGGSGIAGGGGGGGGGLIYTNLALVTGSNAVMVGAGGAGGGYYTDNAKPGSNSVFASLIALGGGGGKLNTNGVAGGSGAGGHGNGAAGGSGSQPGGYGNSGGPGGPNPGGGGGGGGAGSAGSAGVTNGVGGNGGGGRSYDISGGSTGYAGGGGGGAQVGSGGTATDGGGLGGTQGGSGAGSNGSPNTGGGGGGGTFGNVGGAGGSGIVIVRYGIPVP